MGNTEMVCRDCGKELLPTHKFCPQCGTKVDTVDEVVAEDLPACEVCGHENTQGGAYCEACGAKLPGAAVRAEKRGKQKSDESKKQKPAKEERARIKLAPWHYLVGVVLAAVIGLFVYEEWQREYPANTSTVPMQFPASQAASTPPSKEILEAIDRLQKTVSENPNDVGSKLLLANALHDGAIHDGSLLPRAIEAYKTYLKDKPGDPNARVDLGICYFELGKIDSTMSARYFAAAISEMETAVKGTPSHQAGAFNLGIVQLYSGNIKESNRWLQRAVELNAESDLGKRAKAILEQHNQAG